MATLMKCHTPHWQGNIFIPAGTVRPQGHRQAIPVYFEPFETEEPEPAPTPVAKPAKKTASPGAD